MIKEARIKARIKEYERISDECLQRRQCRSFVENDEPLSNSHVILSSHAVDHVPDAGRGEGPHHHALYVIKKDGSKRQACDIYEWLQQFSVEQCAVLLALAEQMPAFAESKCQEDLPCQLGRADGYKAPQLCMGCARWWTKQGQPFADDEPELFSTNLCATGGARSARPQSSLPKCARRASYFSSSSSHSFSCRRWRRTSRARGPS